MSPSSSGISSHLALTRQLGVGGATMMGLGSILGTGVFVSIGLGAGVAGGWVVLAIAIAAMVATFNALNSAQLAASHPISGGTYEYGYRYLSPLLGFSAGWMFLCAKSASAATAALGFAGYLLTMLGYEPNPPAASAGIALVVVIVLTGLVVCGIRLSSRVNIIIVSFTLLTLVTFVLAGLPTAWQRGAQNLPALHGTQAAEAWFPALMHATALMFVAYTGYGRIATLGEEVHHPRTTIPQAIIVTLWVSGGLYIAVATVAVAAYGAVPLAQAVGQQAAPLEVAARSFSVPGVHRLVALGAMTAMLGVLLNLILGLSRVLLAMGRRGDMPAIIARLDHDRTTPPVSVLLTGAIVAVLVLIGDVKLTWSFSAFTVLIYYAITNLAALKLPSDQRLFGRWLGWAGLGSCLFLAFWVEWRFWVTGAVLLVLGGAWRTIAQAITQRT